MTERGRKTASGVARTTLIGSCIVLCASGAERLGDTEASIDRYRSQLENLESRMTENPEILEERIRELALEVERLEGSAGDKTENISDLTAFGIAVRRALSSAGSSVIRYRPFRDGNTILLEFSARGSPLAMSRFLLAAADAGWEVPYLSVRSESASDPVEFNLRIGHAF